MQLKSTNSGLGWNRASPLNLFLIVLCITLGVVLSSCSETSNADGPSDNLRVGVLLDANNQIYPIGKIAITAIQLAAADFNRYMKENGHTKQIEVYIEDTQGDPTIAAEKIQSFAWAGIIPVVTGSSEENMAVSDYAEQNNQLLLSGYSTVTSLSEKDDRLLRFCMPDSRQSKALVRLAQESGLRSVVLVYRDDVFGNDLKNSIVQNAVQYGLDTDQEVKYDPDETDFSAVVSSIEQKVIQETSANPPESVAVLLISLNEVTSIFQAADGRPELESVQWIGAAGAEPDAVLFESTSTLEFAQKVGYTLCDFGVHEANIAWAHLEKVGERQEIFSGK